MQYFLSCHTSYDLSFIVQVIRVRKILLQHNLIIKNVTHILNSYAISFLILFLFMETTTQVKASSST